MPPDRRPRRPGSHRRRHQPRRGEVVRAASVEAHVAVGADASEKEPEAAQRANLLLVPARQSSILAITSSCTRSRSVTACRVRNERSTLESGRPRRGSRRAEPDLRAVLINIASSGRGRSRGDSTSGRNDRSCFSGSAGSGRIRRSGRSAGSFMSGFRPGSTPLSSSRARVSGRVPCRQQAFDPLDEVLGSLAGRQSDDSSGSPGPTR